MGRMGGKIGMMGDQGSFRGRGSGALGDELVDVARHWGWAVVV